MAVQNSRTYAYGTPSPEQIVVIARYVEGRDVHDLGSGFLGWAERLAGMGAKSIRAVDPIYADRYENNLNDFKKWSAPRGVTLIPKTFEEYIADVAPTLDLSFISWPLNHGTHGIEALAHMSKTVIYYGTNFDGTACGTRALWGSLCRRDVLAHIPYRGGGDCQNEDHALDIGPSSMKSTLIVYGKPNRRTRPKLPEERAALDSKKTTRYADAYPET